MSAHVQELDCSVFKSGSIQDSKLPANLIGIDTFPFSHFPQPKFGWVFAVHQLEDGFIDPLSDLRAEVLVAPSKSVCEFSFPRQILLIGVQTLDEFLGVLEVFHSSCPNIPGALLQTLLSSLV